MLKNKSKQEVNIKVTSDNGKEKQKSSSTLMANIEKNKLPSMRSKSQDISQHVSKAQNQKKQFLKDIKKDIRQQKKKIHQSNSSAIIRMQIQAEPPKISVKKERSLLQLSRSLNDRIKMERQVRTKLQEISDQQLDKKQKLEKKIQQIKRKNLLRMKQLNEFQEKYLKKINADYMKDKQKQEKLLQEYEKVLYHHGKIKQTQNYRKAIETEDWRAIVDEKKKLEKMIKEYRKKQDLLLKEQNPEILENIKEQIRRKKALQQVVVQKKSAPKQKVDAKQMGNQYLQYAKKLKQANKEKKIKLLDVNMKCIDYEGDMMNKIARNTGDLSKVRIDPAPITTVQSKFDRSASIKLPVFELKEDEDTKKYLSQIRSNLKQLDKGMKKNGSKKEEQSGVNTNKAILNQINQVKQ